MCYDQKKKNNRNVKSRFTGSTCNKRMSPPLLWTQVYSKTGWLYSTMKQTQLLLWFPYSSTFTATNKQSATRLWWSSPEFKPTAKKTSTKTHHRLNRTMWLACPRADACGKVDHSVRLLCPLFRANSVFSKALSKSLLSWTYSIPGTSASLYVIMNNLQVQNTAESTLLNISFYLQRGCWEIWLAKN